MASAPAIVSLAESRRARGLRVVSVSVVDDRKDADEVRSVAEAAQREHMPYPCYLDEGGKWSARVGATEIPAFLVLGRDGQILRSLHGKVVAGSSTEHELVSTIDAALAH